jgi:hypothetical protein
MILSKRKIVGQCLEYTTQRITQQCIEEVRVCPDREMLGLVYPEILEPQIKISRSMFCNGLDRESICTVFGHSLRL